jgi:FG-GAP-like repeat
MPIPRPFQRQHALVAVVVICAALLLVTVGAAPGRPEAAPKPDPRVGEQRAKQLCVTCHRLPPPDVLPLASWRGVMEKMTRIVAGKGIPGWGAPVSNVVLSDDYAAVLAYYEAKAPQALPTPAPWPAPAESPVQFVRRSIGFKDALTQEPAISHVRFQLDADGHPEVLACDMRQGLIFRARPGDSDAQLVPLGQVPHPAHVAVVDLDADGRQDLLVADLGEFYPGDHTKGAVAWLRGLPGGRFAPPHVFGGFPRVADVEAGDFDGDGKLDLVVAAFGWNRVGGISVLFNRTTDWSKPDFERVEVDARPGSIHVLPVDLNRDGKLDFVALISQEHEAVVAFIGDGKGAFEPQELYRAPHPNWGSSGIQLVDLDGDGDLDILASNGDMFDDDILKPYHGLQWLENKGGLRFEPHPLAPLAGAFRAVAGDLDGDGDLDVVASAFTGMAGGGTVPLPSLVWLEQVAPGRFVRHTLASGQPRYATMDLGDVDGDGDLDVVTGVFRLVGTSEDWLEIWENQTPRRAAPQHK